LRKNIHRFITTWFDQAGRKTRRQRIRKEKAAAVFPRPTDKLRPVVRCQTQRYNIKVKEGKGFTKEELKSVGLNANFARSIGISVDAKRRNKCQESLEANKKRLSAYLSKLVLFPKNENAPKTSAKPVADASKEVLNGFAPSQVNLDTAIPVTQDKKREKVVLKKDIKQIEAYKKIRLEKTNKKWAGIREKKAKESADKEK
jgi:large subunit ribosomal protein L13e